MDLPFLPLGIYMPSIMATMPRCLNDNYDPA